MPALCMLYFIFVLWRCPVRCSLQLQINFEFGGTLIRFLYDPDTNFRRHVPSSPTMQSPSPPCLLQTTNHLLALKVRPFLNQRLLEPKLNIPAPDRCGSQAAGSTCPTLAYLAEPTVLPPSVRGLGEGQVVPIDVSSEGDSDMDLGSLQSALPVPLNWSSGALAHLGGFTNGNTERAPRRWASSANLQQDRPPTPRWERRTRTINRASHRRPARSISTNSHHLPIQDPLPETRDERPIVNNSGVGVTPSTSTPAHPIEEGSVTAINDCARTVSVLGLRS